MTNPTHPRSPYIEGKRCGEAICNIFRETGKNIKIVRLGITYGPGTQKGDTRVINSLIDKGLNNDKIELLDDGSSLRSFCYVTDAIEMMWNIMFKGKEFIYNVANTNSMSILQLSTVIGDILKGGSKVYGIVEINGSDLFNQYILTYHLLIDRS
jgi:nucleoside-diphosphate-sugar epimerase